MSSIFDAQFLDLPFQAFLTSGYFTSHPLENPRELAKLIGALGNSG